MKFVPKTNYEYDTKTNKIEVKQLGFIKQDGIWYANLPEFLEQGLGSKEKLMMVDGADTFLDVLSRSRPMIHHSN